MKIEPNSISQHEQLLVTGSFASFLSSRLYVFQYLYIPFQCCHLVVQLALGTLIPSMQALDIFLNSEATVGMHPELRLNQRP